MSWRDDYRIRQAISTLPSGGSGVAPRLICCPSEYVLDTSTLKRYRNYGVVVPNRVEDWTSTTSTFETDSVFQIFMYHPLSGATGMTWAGMDYIGTYSVWDWTYETNPPFIYLHWHVYPYKPLSSYTGVNGAVYFVTKHGWKINGVSYPSQQFVVRWDG